uniref:Nuclear export mediator factor NEMF n=1 Tax=Acrobeloides nanus TaxID=290746 RepID=A0A914EJD4_9BILA
MKSKFSTIDLFAIVHELKSLIGMRVANVYDIDSKTYLIKLQKPEHKEVILFESGIRIHRTTHDWPKSQMPSGFSMKFRKHIKEKRLTNVQQLGVDRMIDLQFGDDDRACHVIIELYDRGNVVLTDHNYIILNILRPRTDKDHDVRFKVRERYPIEQARKDCFIPSIENIKLFLESSNNEDVLRKALIRQVPFGSALLDHAFVAKGIPIDAKVKDNIDPRLIEEALTFANSLYNEFRTSPSKGFITYKTLQSSEGNEIQSYQEYHPFSFTQFQNPEKHMFVKEFPSFSEAVDTFYSLLDDQKAEQQAMAAEKEAVKKLNNVKKDHETRIKALEEVQITQQQRAERIELNRELVEKALALVRFAIARKMSWEDIPEWMSDLRNQGVDAAQAIVKLDFHSNSFTMSLEDPFNEEEKPIKVEIDIDLTADQNCRKYFDDRKKAVEKQNRTVLATTMALKSAQQQTKTKIDQVRAKKNFLRARKTFWFEKFFWFISSDKYLVIAGRDFQQNELLVKRYLRPGDVYVHADIHGGCSVVIRNRNKDMEIPPKTLHEAGSMAVCYSSAWESNIAAKAWWVRNDQVSRTAPTGEYLPAGSFMIRGTKNYLPISQLVLGFGLMFKIDEESVQRHRSMNSAASTVFSENLETESTVPESGNDLADNEEELEIEADEENGEKEEDTEGESDGDKEEFPDIQLNLQSMKIMNNTETEQAEEYTMFQLDMPSKATKKPSQREKFLAEQRKKEAEETAKKAAQDQNKQKGGPLTKRQKHKLEKIKRKYKDQDEEERELRLQLLGSVKKEEKVETERPYSSRGKPQESSTQPTKSDQKQTDNQKTDGEQEDTTQADPESTDQEKPDEENLDDPQEDDEELAADGGDAAILETLTYIPLPEDTLLFVTPVCAPYSTMQKFKFKVKITPGTGKRGKAAKAALALFQRDKTLSLAEKTLIKGLTTDNFVAQNIPGKVRVSAPQLLKAKK